MGQNCFQIGSTRSKQEEIIVCHASVIARVFCHFHFEMSQQPLDWLPLNIVLTFINPHFSCKYFIIYSMAWKYFYTNFDGLEVMNASDLADPQTLL